jgi:hypothetical protein
MFHLALINLGLQCVNRPKMDSGVHLSFACASLGLGLARDELESGTDPGLEFVRQVLPLLEDRWHF